MSDPFATYPVVDEPAAVPVHDPIGLERYQFLRFLSQGGMGEVLLVEDQRLHCQVAMKVVGQAVRNSSAAILRFQEEAQITAQLSHPAIIPIHDLGTLADGRAYYTMPVVGGPRLADAMEAWHRGGDHSGWTLHRLVDSFRTVCEAIAYAHTRSVIHRDLKPGNVMVGSHGEVLVLDWGLAKIWTRQEERGWEEEEAPITSDRASIPAFQTRAGSVFGTMAYMAPEQALGEGHRAGPPADVYALGVMLWEMLLGRVPPRVELEPLPENPAGPHAVPELLELARRALQRAPESRISAADFAGALQSYLEGAERRDRAMKLVVQARRLQREEATLRRDADAHRKQGEALLARTRPLDPIEKKRPAWEKQDLATRSSREADLAHLEVQRLLGAALLQAPDLVEAHDDLAELYHQEHVQAEAAGDHATALRAERLLAGHDRGRFRPYLAGNGAVTLHTEPSGARVNLYRYVEQDRHLVPVFARDLGPTPLKAVELPMGSWLLRIQAPGRATVEYPVYVRRLEHRDGCPPHSTTPYPFYLPFPEELGPNDCYVPAGWFHAGGDPEAIYSWPARRYWLEAFVMQRFPVSHGDWLGWLNSLWQRDGEAQALPHVPRDRSIRPEDVKEGYGRTEMGFQLVPDADGEVWNPDYPVFRVDHRDACAYAADLSRQSGLPWRLPRDLEWEKAARGVDARLYPWGNTLDLTFSRSLDSGSQGPAPALPHEHPMDTSPYGVRHLGGNMRCWCADPAIPEPFPEGPLPPLSSAPAALYWNRGGTWTAHPRGGRGARRHGDAVQDRIVDLGVRLVRTIGF